MRHSLTECATVTSLSSAAHRQPHLPSRLPVHSPTARYPPRLAAVADQDALTAKATIYSMVSGALLTDYQSPKNAQLQTTPTVSNAGLHARFR